MKTVSLSKSCGVEQVEPGAMNCSGVCDRMLEKLSESNYSNHRDLYLAITLWFLLMESSPIAIKSLKPKKFCL